MAILYDVHTLFNKFTQTYVSFYNLNHNQLSHNKATDEPRLREVFGAFGSVTDVFLPVSFTFSCLYDIYELYNVVSLII